MEIDRGVNVTVRKIQAFEICMLILFYFQIPILPSRSIAFSFCILHFAYFAFCSALLIALQPSSARLWIEELHAPIAAFKYIL